MAESLLAIALVTTSAKGGNLVFRWPPSPESLPRLCRPKPDDQVFSSQLDNPWRASSFHQHPPGKQDDRDYVSDPDYRWRRSNSRTPPSDPTTSDPRYDYMLGYSCEFLATLLCPQRSMCHQRFELVVDDLAFVGHPVCADEGRWEFKQEKVKPGSRGRIPIPDGNGSVSTSTSTSAYRSSASPEKPTERSSSNTDGATSWLQKFQLVLVLDLPDPSSSASGNVAKYFDIIYEQIAFTFTAVLFQEQVLNGFVERECDALISLQESLVKKEEPYDVFVHKALQISSIASAMRSVYDAIKSRSIAYVSLNAIPLELQLPPHLDDLLHAESDYDIDSIARPDDEEIQHWGPELSFGWKLPGLAPWKSLLLLDGENELEDPFVSLRSGNTVNGEEKALAESLVRFLETASITLSLADMGNFLDWDLEEQVYPVVRWLVLHRRAKIVDTVNLGLKTIFALPSKFSTPLSKLSEEFSAQFSHPEIPPLPQILASLSSSLAKQSDNPHFFASVVKKKELIPMFHDVVMWMLKRDLLITLHLRIRIIATRELKVRVNEARERAWAKKSGKSGKGPGMIGSGGIGESLRRAGAGVLQPPNLRSPNHDLDFDEFDEEFDGKDEGDGDESSTKTPSGIAWLPLSPTTRTAIRRRRSGGSGGGRRGRRLSSADSRSTSISELVIREEEEGDMNGFDDDFDDNEDGFGEGGNEEGDDESDGTQLSDSEAEDNIAATMINDPGRATPRQRRWLTAMSEGQEPHIAKRFDEINQYFDGKRSDDEILFRAEITRRQLREVLHHYEPYLQTFLHPS